MHTFLSKNTYKYVPVETQELFDEVPHSEEDVRRTGEMRLSMQVRNNFRVE